MFYDDDMNENEGLDSRPDYTVEDALKVLPLAEDALIIPAEVILGFSDLETDQVAQIRPTWQKLPQAQRVMIMERLAEVSEVDYALDYSEFANLGYDDPDSEVRVASIQAGWADESVGTLKKLMNLAKNDPTSDVRAAAVSQLGQFIYLGEVEEMSRTHTDPAEELALSLLRNPQETLDVQRRALEALSHASRPGLSDLIKEAYRHDDLYMRISAVNAMGNTCDPMWTDIVMTELESEENEMRFEAIKASGELGLKQAIPALTEYGYDDDRQVQEAAIWSLGEIGGEEAIQVLNELDLFAQENEDDELIDAIDEALSMATVITDMEADFDLLVADEDYDDDGYDSYEEEEYEDEE